MDVIFGILKEAFFSHCAFGIETRGKEKDRPFGKEFLMRRLSLGSSSRGGKTWTQFKYLYVISRSQPHGL